MVEKMDTRSVVNPWRMSSRGSVVLGSLISLGILWHIIMSMDPRMQVQVFSVAYVPPGNVNSGSMKHLCEGGCNGQSEVSISAAQELPNMTKSGYGPPINALEELHYALETMQNYYFQLWLGTWPSCIDWTGAVLGTFVSASLFSLTRSLEYILPLPSSKPPSHQSDTVTLEGQRIENEINKYFSQSVAYYFGEDYFGIRTQAYDDMLWVVLGWLESVRFVKLHTRAHYTRVTHNSGDTWYGRQFVPAFAHRAHVFYDIAARGWDTKLCGGGMNWNPHLTPYKNAITNELYISASIGMYLYFPGDRNTSPFLSLKEEKEPSLKNEGEKGKGIPHDPEYLHNAIIAYDWLKNSNMTNEKGLYVDGFHIKDWRKDNYTGTGKCDDRDEMVYTYNQGVLLSGLRGLWEGTGKLAYLQDGHALVRNVIAATGFKSSTERTQSWEGLGRNGILEEVCDEDGTCSQNGQTFKGIFFHHLTLFCEPLPRVAAMPGKTFSAGPIEAGLHRQSCKEYAAWVAWNARAALGTRNKDGKFGMWWGAGVNKAETRILMPIGAEDVRNRGLGNETIWGSGWTEGVGITIPHRIEDDGVFVLGQRVLSETNQWIDAKSGRPIPQDPEFPMNLDGPRDLNDRGRGRTVETQGGGVAVVRAMWEFIGRYSDNMEFPWADGCLSADCPLPNLSSLDDEDVISK